MTPRLYPHAAASADKRYSLGTLVFRSLGLTSKKLALIALAIWGTSLPLTGIVLYAKQQHLSGLEILMMGWLSPLVLNFAWFANVFFVYAVFQLLRGRAALKSSLLAVALSFDTFRFDMYLMNEGGSSTPVYGYGWGAVLWFLSISLLLSAAATREQEKEGSFPGADVYVWLQPLSFALALLTVGTAGVFAWRDRSVANSTEALRLTGLAFKRGEICGSPEPVVTNPIRNLSGPVEVVIEKDALYANYPFAQVKDLLKWGIPTVRIGNTDYSYESIAHSGLLSSTPAKGAPAAILYVNESYLRTISVKLVETSTNRTVFEQTWERENHPVNTNYYCPDYHSFPSLNEQPRQLLMQALNLHATKATSREIAQETRVFDRIEGNIIGRKDGGTTRAMKIAGWKEMNPNNKTSVPYNEIFNTNCPSDIGWHGSNYESRQNTGWPFMVKGKAYYPRHRDRYNATCEGEFAYIYAGTARDGKYYLNIEKRDIQDFRQVWAGIVVVSDVNPSTRDDVLKIQSIKKATGAVTIELINEDSGQVLLVQAPLHDK